jgi:hypothetical protein
LKKKGVSYKSSDNVLNHLNVIDYKAEILNKTDKKRKQSPDIFYNSSDIKVKDLRKPLCFYKPVGNCISCYELENITEKSQIT